PAVLTEALRATCAAVDRTLRGLLRSDSTAPDSIRLTAMSPDLMSADVVMQELRRRDLIPLDLAGLVHELRQAAERAGAGDVRAADADVARQVARRLEAEVRRLGAASQAIDADGARAMDGSLARAPDAVAGSDLPTSAILTGTRPGEGSWRQWPADQRRPVVLVVAAVVLLIAAAVAVALLTRGSALEQGIAAFGDGREDVAEQYFRAALQADPHNVTAGLYLARILRRDGRHQEAAQLLQAAATTDAEDAAVRRELGYLFLDLGRPGSAATQFRRAVEIDAADPLNWAGVVHALRETGDTTEATEWLRRAPARAREMMQAP